MLYLFSRHVSHAGGPAVLTPGVAIAAVVVVIRSAVTGRKRDKMDGTEMATHIVPIARAWP